MFTFAIHFIFHFHHCVQATRLTKQDLGYICFEEILNQLNLIYFYIY
jgi:hypothetical protein